MSLVENAANQAQLKAINHTNGPMLVVAGAGTGKTKVIVERLKKLVNDEGVPQKNILALTFTEKAAQEMSDRTNQSLGQIFSSDLNIYTFNGFGHELLSEFAIEIGLSSNLKLIGDNGKVVLLKENLDQLGLDYFAPVSRPDRLLKDIGDYFSKLKQQLILPASYQKYSDSLPASDDEQKLEKKRHQELANAYKKYTEITLSKNIIDYDDQIYLLVQLLETRPNVLSVLHKRYKYIMVDEFQDTNPMQSRLIDLLASDTKNIFVVGDDDQSIYGWRGATLANILDFTKRYPEAKQTTLIENFRSTQEILDAAYKLIQNNNPDRLEVINKLDKKLVAHRGSGIEPQIKKFSQIEFELSWVAEDIVRRIKGGENPGQIAVLARSKDSVNKMHLALDAIKVDHVTAGVSEDLYSHTAVTSIIEIIRTILEPGNNQALFHALSSDFFECDALLVANASHKTRREHGALENELRKTTDQKILQSIKLIDDWRLRTKATNIRKVAYDILADTGYLDKINNLAEKSEIMAKTAQALGQWFGTLNDFQQVSSMPSALNYLDSLETLRAEGEMLNDDTLSLDNSKPVVMTAHKAKGLEWQVVYLIDCVDGRFPLKPRSSGLKVPDELSVSSSADDHYAEERRLMYVATTRARDELIISHSEKTGGASVRKASRFLDEMCNYQDGPAQNQIDRLTVVESPVINNKISLPATLISGDRLVLTASQADDYLTCPLNFYYRHVLGVPTDASAVTESGSLLHNLIQQINEAKINDRQVPSKTKLLDELKASWPKVGYSSKIQHDRALQLGVNSFDILYDRLISEPVPIAVEEPFKVHIPDSRLILKGRIDVVMPEDSSGIQIHDYKSSTSVDSGSKAKSRTTNSKQLVMYALAWRLTRGEDPTSVCLDFIQTGQIGVVKKKSDSLDKMQNLLSQAAEDILAGKFPLGSSHEFCDHP